MPSKIEWTNETWNPAHGCTKVSDGCKHCYAAAMAKRLQAMKTPGYENGFAVTTHTDRLSTPLQRKKPTLYFVNSMGDLFHDDIPREFIVAVMDVIRACPQHQFQILTKYHERMISFFGGYDMTEQQNMRVGVSVENIKHGIPRVDSVRRFANNFLSIEPLLEDIADHLDLTNIDWVIVGGESGPKARPMYSQWVRNIRDLCEQSNVPFFFKQWGTWFSNQEKVPFLNTWVQFEDEGEYCYRLGKKKAGHLLDGKEYRQMPVWR
jgi:protein gp37